jgi:hypothetical protein
VATLAQNKYHLNYKKCNLFHCNMDQNEEGRKEGRVKRTKGTNGRK